MSRFSIITSRDRLLLKALSLQVRLLGQRQLAEAFWAGDIANTRRRMRVLKRAGLILRDQVLAQPLPEIFVPVATWRPGMPEPDAGKVAFVLQSRWRFRAPRVTVVYKASPRTIDHFGGSHHRTMSAQVTHDLGVSAVWLWYCQNRPEFAARWVGEDLVKEDFAGEALPDAVIVDPENKPGLLIEFGGQYSKDRVAAFNEMAVTKQLPYQIW